METVKAIKQRFDDLHLDGFKDESDIKKAVEKLEDLFDIEKKDENIVLIPKDYFSEMLVEKVLEPFAGMETNIVVHRRTETLALALKTSGRTFSGALKEIEKKLNPLENGIPIQKLKEIPESIDIFFTENGIEVEGNSDADIDVFLEKTKKEEIAAFARIRAERRRGMRGISEKEAKLLKKLFDVKIVKLKESGQSLILVLKKQHVPKAAVFACLPLLNSLFKPVSVEENGAAFLMRTVTEKTAVQLYKILSPLKKPESAVAAYLLGPKKDLPAEIRKAALKFPSLPEREKDWDTDGLEALKKGFKLYGLSDPALNGLFVLNEGADEETQEEALRAIGSTNEKGMGEGVMVLDLPEKIRGKIFLKEKSEKNILPVDEKKFEALAFWRTDKEHVYEMSLTSDAAEVYLLGHYGGLKAENGRLLFQPLPEYRKEWKAFLKEKDGKAAVEKTNDLSFLQEKVGFTITYTDENGNIWFTVDRKQPLTEDEERILSGFSKGIINCYEAPDRAAVIKKATGTQNVSVKDLARSFYIQKANDEEAFVFTLKEPQIGDFEKIRLQDVLEQHVVLPQGAELKDTGRITGVVRFKDEHEPLMKACEKTAEKWLGEKRIEIDGLLENKYELTENDKVYLARRLRGEQIVIPDERHMLPLSESLVGLLTQKKAKGVHASAPVVLSSADLVKRFTNGGEVIRMSMKAKEEKANLQAARLQKRLGANKAA